MNKVEILCLVLGVAFLVRGVYLLSPAAAMMLWGLILIAAAMPSRGKGGA